MVLKNIIKGLNPLKDYLKHDNSVQFIGVTKRGVLGTKLINELVQEKIFDVKRKYLYEDGEYKYYENDKVINLVNNYDMNITNGEIGFLKDFTLDKKEMKLTLEGKDHEMSKTYLNSLLTLGYCITTHKAQGSEFDTVVFMLDKASMMLLNNNLIYTAITRAKKKLLIIGDIELFKQTILKKEKQRETVISFINKKHKQ
jgi:exodeoxyribonuclease V alpha subunit